LAVNWSGRLIDDTFGTDADPPIPAMPTYSRASVLLNIAKPTVPAFTPPLIEIPHGSRLITEHEMSQTVAASDLDRFDVSGSTRVETLYGPVGIPGISLVSAESTVTVVPTVNAMKQTIRFTCVDLVKPSCEGSADGDTLTVTVQDTLSGVATVTHSSTNATVDVGSFTSGTKQEVTITATKDDTDEPAKVSIRVIDVAGNITDCDPVLVTVRAGTIGVISHVPPDEHYLRVSNAPRVLAIVVRANHMDHLILWPASHYDSIVDLGDLGEGRVSILVVGPRGSSADLMFADATVVGIG